jgi:RNA recognition motif-containing protein
VLNVLSILLFRCCCLFGLIYHIINVHDCLTHYPPISTITHTDDDGDKGVPSKKRKAEPITNNEESTEGGDHKRQHVGSTDEEGGVKVYVRGLPWRATEEEVRTFFEACGEIVSVELPLMDDGRSSGSGECIF